MSLNTTVDVAAVFPTCVGMVRSEEIRSMKTACFPHMRGDGP